MEEVGLTPRISTTHEAKSVSPDSEVRFAGGQVSPFPTFGLSHTGSLW